MHLKSMCILLLWDGFCICLLCPRGLMSPSKPLFTFWFFVWMIYWCKLSPLLLLSYYQLLPLCLLLAALFLCVLPCWVHIYMQLLHFLFGLFPLWLCSFLFCLVTDDVLKSILSYINIATPSFFSLHFTW